MSDQAAVEALSGEELRERIYQVLNHEYPPFRELMLPIEVEVDGSGRVVLRGWVRTPTMKHMATKLTQEVPGVQEVKNELFVDDELERAVALALEQEPALEDDFPGIKVDVLAGIVTLWGEVTSEAERQKAAEIARQVPGVRRVINDLRVRNGDNGHERTK